MHYDITWNNNLLQDLSRPIQTKKKSVINVLIQITVLTSVENGGGGRNMIQFAS